MSDRARMDPAPTGSCTSHRGTRSTTSFTCLAIAILATFSWTAVAQPPAAPPPAAGEPLPEEAAAPADQAAPADMAPADMAPADMAPKVHDSPYAAYDAGSYEQALQGFVDQQVEHPENPEVALNLGSVHYRMKNYEEADRAFAQAALAVDDALRAQALYNLGNSAYQQGRLQEAVELYKAALEHDSDDEDAKFNLELVRDEIRRRHEEAQKRQQEQQQQQQGDQGDQQQGDQQQGDQQQGDQQQGGEPQDSDGDGLADELERSAPNPTDPENPDTDGDGLADGQEDQNRNGRPDEGETDPNKPDTDGDGVSDGEEARQQEGEGGGEPQDEEQEGLTPEEAERYLQSLEDGLPQQKRRMPPGSRRARPEKDW